MFAEDLKVEAKLFPTKTCHVAQLFLPMTQTFSKVSTSVINGVLKTGRD